jgi:hypothetical protein
MTTATAQTISEMIDELHRDAARNLALAFDSEARFPWRRHDPRIYRERAQVALQAAAHLMEA